MHGHHRRERTGPKSTDWIVAALPQPAPSTELGTAAPLPMPTIPLHQRTSSAVYALARIDASGRVADNTTPKALAWPLGQVLLATVIDDVSIALQPGRGTARICTRRHVVLPASARHRCGITAGDLLLLVALPHRELLRVHTLAYLDAVLADKDRRADSS